MAKIFYVIAVACLVVAIFDIKDAPDGSRAQIEGGILIILAPIFAVIGFFVGRATTKVCPACSERIKSTAIKCKHCGTELTTASAAEAKG